MVIVTRSLFGGRIYNCTYVIRQGNECKLPEDDTFVVETCRRLIINIFVIIVFSLCDLQIIKRYNLQ